MKVKIKDDFDLYRIVESGQCFRPRLIDEKTYMFICREHILYIHKICDDEYDVSCSLEEWNNVWTSYFDLNTSYCDIRKGISSSDKYMKECADCSVGIRILQQDKWEMLISYIISQRKSIPAIRSSIEKLCSKFGDSVETLYGEIHIFPTAKQLREASTDELAQCGLGYRLEYIEQAAQLIYNNPDLLEQLSELDDEKLYTELIALKGVGKKVANCVMLFGYHRTGRAPVDVWIQRVIDEHYDGINIFESYGKEAGIMQQFVFYYRRLIEIK